MDPVTAAAATVQLKWRFPENVVAVFIWNITDWDDPLPEILAVNWVFNVP